MTVAIAKDFERAGPAFNFDPLGSGITGQASEPSMVSCSQIFRRSVDRSREAVRFSPIGMRRYTERVRLVQLTPHRMAQQHTSRNAHETLATRSNVAPQGAVAVKLGEHLAGLITFA